MPQQPPSKPRNQDSSTSEPSDQQPLLRKLPPLRKRVMDWKNPDREQQLRRRAGLE